MLILIGVWWTRESSLHSTFAYIWIFFIIKRFKSIAIFQPYPFSNLLLPAEQAKLLVPVAPDERDGWAEERKRVLSAPHHVPALLPGFTPLRTEQIKAWGTLLLCHSLLFSLLVAYSFNDWPQSQLIDGQAETQTSLAGRGFRPEQERRGLVVYC